jgi:hypothetical protein
MAQNQPKFIQIAAASGQINGLLISQLYALDEEGNVWSYHFQERGGDNDIWVKLKSDRK